MVDKENEACEGQPEDARGDINDRAYLAMCSLMADVWFTTFEAFVEDDCASTKELKNFMVEANQLAITATNLLDTVGGALPAPANTVLETLDGCAAALSELGLTYPGEFDPREFSNPACDTVCQSF